ncbi:hypothetical protein AA313_de0207392 [Arthrobotrys entomopaga]|nr:hypothetical protein AA313_de0207392 [Arthrobotrys entomopaga]
MLLQRLGTGRLARGRSWDRTRQMLSSRKLVRLGRRDGQDHRWIVAQQSVPLILGLAEDSLNCAAVGRFGCFDSGRVGVRLAAVDVHRDRLAVVDRIGIVRCDDESAAAAAADGSCNRSLQSERQNRLSEERQSRKSAAVEIGHHSRMTIAAGDAGEVWRRHSWWWEERRHRGHQSRMEERRLVGCSRLPDGA